MTTDTTIPQPTTKPNQPLMQQFVGTVGAADTQPAWVPNLPTPLGFNARSVIVDNPTGQWIYIPSAGQYVQPNVMGRIMRLLESTRTAQALARTPPTQTSTVTPGGEITVTFSSIPLMSEGGEVLSLNFNGGAIATPLLLPDGTVTLPALAWANDVDGGWYRIADGDFGFAVEGAKVLEVAATGLIMSSQVLSLDGTVGAPGLSWNTDPDAGWYRIGDGDFGFAVEGVKVLEVTSLGLTIAGVGGATSGGLIGFAAGTLNYGDGASNRVLMTTSQNFTVSGVWTGVQVHDIQITQGGSTTIGAGAGTVHMSTGNPATNTAWIPINYAGTVYYVPGWTTNAP